MSDKPLMPKIVQPLCFSLRNLNNLTRKQSAYPSLSTMERLKLAGENYNTVRVNVLTPSPERLRPGKHAVNVISDDSDVEELPPYSLPPTPSISDDSDDLFVLSCLPKVKSVTSLKETSKENNAESSRLMLIPTVKSVTTVPECHEIPSNLRVHPCHWRECYTSCETPETLHKHILATHCIIDELVCEWTGCSQYGKTFRNISLFGRHIQAHTGALNFACIWDCCNERFKRDCLLQAHCLSHLRKKTKYEESKKKKEEGKKKKEEGEKKKEEGEKQTVNSPCLGKRKLISLMPVVRQNYINVLEENDLDRKAMKFVRKKISLLQNCADGYKVVDLSSKKVGFRSDMMTGKQWLLQAKRDSTLMRWSTNESAKISVTWKNCPDTVLVQLGLLSKHPRRRKQRKTS